MKQMVNNSIITLVSIIDSDAGRGRLRVPGDGAFANGISLPGSGDR